MTMTIAAPRLTGEAAVEAARARLDAARATGHFPRIEDDGIQVHADRLEVQVASLDDLAPWLLFWSADPVPVAWTCRHDAAGHMIEVDEGRAVWEGITVVFFVVVVARCTECEAQK